jgi:PAS domain S-box-containing protein
VQEHAGPDHYFRSVMEAAPDGFMIVNGEGVIELVNGQVEALFGYDRSELVGQPIEVLVPMRFHGAHHRQRAGYSAKPRLRPMLGTERDLYARRKDGSEFPVEISLAPIRTDAGTVISAIIRDVSERKRLQEESDRIREELIATVSHELRTPLSSIIGYTELLSDLGEGHLSAEARELLEVIERNARRELCLVDDLLTLASMTSGRMMLNQEPIDVERLATDAVRAMRPRAEAQGLSVVMEVEATGSTTAIRGDAVRLGQVLDNLLTNAVKFTPRGGVITVALRRDEAYAVVEIRDTGVGVPAEEVALIFERLYRARHAVEKHVQGAGLGLSIAKAIVDAHEGAISVESEVGHGTTVSVRLPLEPSAQNNLSVGSSSPRSAS